MSDKLRCTQCGGKLQLTTEGVHVFGGSGGPSPIVRLRCEKCGIDRVFMRKDIEKDLIAEGYE